MRWWRRWKIRKLEREIALLDVEIDQLETTKQQADLAIRMFKLNSEENMRVAQYNRIDPGLIQRLEAGLRETCRSLMGFNKKKFEMERQIVTLKLRGA